MYRNMETYVDYCCRGKVDGIVFGHTHKAGQQTFEDKPVRHVWNCGTFLREAPDSHLGSFITISLDRKIPLNEAVEVHLL